MSLTKVEQSELPEYISCPFAMKGYKTADGAITIPLWAAGHHPKMRIVRAGVFVFTCGTTMTFTIADGDGTAATTATNSGTTVGATVECVLVANQYFDRNEAVNIVVSAAGATALVLIFVQCESID